MKISRSRCLTLAILGPASVFSDVLVGPAFARADESDIWKIEDKWKDAPMEFKVPPPLGLDVLAYAHDVIDHWYKWDHGGMAATPFIRNTPFRVETVVPQGPGKIGFVVTRRPLPDGELMSVEALHFTGLFDGGQKGNTEKRGHLLAYILGQYAATLTAPRPFAPPVAPGRAFAASAPLPPPLPAELEDFMVRLRVQMSQKDYDQAIDTLDALRSNLRDKRRAVAAADTPPAALPQAP